MFITALELEFFTYVKHMILCKYIVVHLSAHKEWMPKTLVDDFIMHLYYYLMKKRNKNNFVLCLLSFCNGLVAIVT